MNKSVEELKEFFKHDRYVVLSDIEIVSVDDERAICKVELKDKHLNAGNVAQGGLLFTLADFTFAAHANAFNDVVTQSATINYIRSPKGKTVFAQATPVGETKRSVVYRVSLYDELGTNIAEMQALGNKRV